MIRGRVFGAAVAVVVLGTGLILLGVEVPFALAWGVLAGVVVLLSALPFPDPPSLDAPRRDDQRPSGSEVSRLAWSINPRTGAVGEIVTRRVRATLRRRLTAEGIDVDDPDGSDRVDARIGPGVWAALNAGRTDRVAIERALDAIDRLQPERSGAASAHLEENS